MGTFLSYLSKLVKKKERSDAILNQTKDILNAAKSNESPNNLKNSYNDALKVIFKTSDMLFFDMYSRNPTSAELPKVYKMRDAMNSVLGNSFGLPDNFRQKVTKNKPGHPSGNQLPTLPEFNFDSLPTPSSLNTLPDNLTIPPLAENQRGIIDLVNFEKEMEGPIPAKEVPISLPASSRKTPANNVDSTKTKISTNNVKTATANNSKLSVDKSTIAAAVASEAKKLGKNIAKAADDVQEKISKDKKISVSKNKAPKKSAKSKAQKS